MDNENVDVQVEQEIAEQEETTVEATTEESTDEGQTDEVVISKEKFKAMQRKAMAYDAMKKTPQAPKQENITNTLTREEAILIAKGMEEEDLAKLQTIVKGTGLSLAEAQKDPLFTAYLEKKEAEKKAERAKLGASKGSGYKEQKPGITSPGLSSDEHKKLWSEIVKKS